MIDERLVTKDYLDHRLKDLEKKIIITLGGMIISAVAVLGTLIKILG